MVRHAVTAAGAIVDVGGRIEPAVGMSNQFQRVAYARGKDAKGSIGSVRVIAGFRMHVERRALVKNTVYVDFQYARGQDLLRQTPVWRAAAARCRSDLLV